MHSNDIYHFGVKGMKWGVRRYQNKDGSLTPAGKKLYNDPVTNIKDAYTKSTDFIKSKYEGHRNNLIDSYKKNGYSQSAAETMADRRIKTELVLASAAAVTAGIVINKAATRFGQDYVDKTIKSGKVVQNIGVYENATFKDSPFFAAINKHDKKAYANMYPLEKLNMQYMHSPDPGDVKIFNNKIKIKNNIKVASTNNAKKIFESKMKKDSEFRNEVLSTLEKTAYGNMDKSISDYRNSGKVSKKLYDRFNQALATPEIQSKGLHNKFYDELKKNGYDAILDINDTRYSGYKKISKSPTIFFNGDKMEKLSAEQINKSTILPNAIKYGAGNAGKQLLKKVGAVSSTAFIYSNYNRQKIIRQYLDEHPNSKLTEAEILKAVKGGK